MFFAALAAAVAIAIPVLANPGAVGTASGFEDDDGNLIDNAPLFDPSAGTGDIDWNNFAPLTWNDGTQVIPGADGFQKATKTFNGWSFVGLTDAAATTKDSAFDGGVKQDDSCAGVGTQKADNKADLKRYYLSFKTVNNHNYLNLAWVRIPQNTTSPSAHVAFEFNQSTTSCGTDSPLVERQAGDILVLYDFEGGATSTPTIRLSKWITPATSGNPTCEVTGDPPTAAGCWGTANTLTSGQAEARVNTTGSVQDDLPPGGSENLGTNEFGEAGIDLTASGVTTTIGCGGFANTFAVSRTSGNSGTAQMKDLVGPASLANNCGVSTAQDWLPNDTANVSGGVGGYVDFVLYSDDSCTTAVSPQPDGLTNRTVTNGVASTNNSGTNVYKVSGAGPHAVSWKATFHPTSGSAVTSGCEKTTMTITN